MFAPSLMIKTDPHHMANGVNRIISAILSTKHGIEIMPEVPKPRPINSITPTWETVMMSYIKSPSTVQNEILEWDDNKNENTESTVKEEKHE